MTHDALLRYAYNRVARIYPTLAQEIYEWARDLVRDGGEIEDVILEVSFVDLHGRHGGPISAPVKRRLSDEREFDVAVLRWRKDLDTAMQRWRKRWQEDFGAAYAVEDTREMVQLALMDAGKMFADALEEALEEAA